MRKGFLAGLAGLGLAAPAAAADRPFPRDFGLRVTGLAGDAAGTQVATVDDVDGDGRDDLVVGSPRGGSGDSGAAFVVRRGG